MKFTILLVVAVLCWFRVAGDDLLLNKQARKKMDAALKTVFKFEDLSLVPVLNEDFIKESAGTSALSNTYIVIHEKKTIGYVHFGSATGRYETFDFLVIYSSGLIIEHVEILEYRSDRGVEIMNKRWLAQFKGTNGCELEYGKSIDAISGATLSGNSLVKAIIKQCEANQKILQNLP